MENTFENKKSSIDVRQILRVFFRSFLKMSTFARKPQMLTSLFEGEEKRIQG